MIKKNKNIFNILILLLIQFTFIGVSFAGLSGDDIKQMEDNGGTLSNPYISYNECILERDGYNVEYPSFKRTDCFQNSGKYKYFICREGISCNIGQLGSVGGEKAPLVGTNNDSSYMLSDSLKSKLDTFLKAVKLKKDSLGLSKWKQSVNSLLSKLRSLKVKYKSNEKVVSVIDYLYKGLKDLLKVSDLDSFFCDLTGECDNYNTNNNAIEKKIKMTITPNSIEKGGKFKIAFGIEGFNSCILYDNKGYNSIGGKSKKIIYSDLFKSSITVTPYSNTTYKLICGDKTISKPVVVTTGNTGLGVGPNIGTPNNYESSRGIFRGKFCTDYDCAGEIDAAKNADGVLITRASTYIGKGSTPTSGRPTGKKLSIKSGEEFSIIIYGLPAYGTKACIKDKTNRINYVCTGLVNGKNGWVYSNKVWRFKGSPALAKDVYTGYFKYENKRTTANVLTVENANTGLGVGPNIGTTNNYESSRGIFRGKFCTDYDCAGEIDAAKNADGVLITRASTYIGKGSTPTSGIPTGKKLSIKSGEEFSIIIYGLPAYGTKACIKDKTNRINYVCTGLVNGKNGWVYSNKVWRFKGSPALAKDVYTGYFKYENKRTTANVLTVENANTGLGVGPNIGTSNNYKSSRGIFRGKFCKKYDCKDEIEEAKDLEGYYDNSNSNIEQNTENNLVLPKVFDRDITYKGNLKLDIKLPERTGKIPIYVGLPGGGWVSGDRKQFFENVSVKPFSDTLINGGIGVISIDYTLSKGNSPKIVGSNSVYKDLDCALQWVEKNKDIYNLDTDNIYIGGISAGGHISMQYSLKQSAYKDISCPSNTVTPIVKKVVSAAGGYDLSIFNEKLNKYFNRFLGFGDNENEYRINAQRSKMNSPLYSLGGGKDKKYFIVYSDKDELFNNNDYQGIPMYNAMKKAGYNVLYDGTSDTVHGAIYMGNGISGKILQFLKGTLKKSSPILPISNIDGLKYEKIEGIDILTLKGGTDYQKGFFHGQKLKTGIKEVLLGFKNLSNKSAGNGYDASSKSYDDLQEESKKFLPYISENIINEMKGIASGAGVKFTEILLINTYDDLSLIFGCSSMIAPKTDFLNDYFIHTRNLDYPIPELARNNVLFKYDTHISVGFAGYIGVLTGVGEKGISISSHRAYSINNSNFGIPSGLLYRKVAVESSTIIGAKNILINAGNKRTIANSLMVGSYRENKGIVAEFDSKQIDFRDMGDTFKGNIDEKILISTNHYRTKGMQNVTRGGKNQRYDQYFDLMKSINPNNKVSLSNIIGVISYYKETQDLVWDSISNNSTVQSVIMVPGYRNIYIANGKTIPVTSGKFVKIIY